jgi:hypothetical protein
MDNGSFDWGQQWGQHPIRTIQYIARATRLIFNKINKGAFTKSAMQARTLDHFECVPGGLKDQSHEIFAKVQTWSKAHFSSAHTTASSSIQ